LHVIQKRSLSMRIPALLLILACVGCASAPNVPTTLDQTPGARPGVITTSTSADVRIAIDTDPSQHMVKGGLKAVWSTLADVYESLPVPLDFADGRGYRAGNTHWVTRGNIGEKPMSTYLRCGIGPAGQLADTHRITMSIITELKSIASDTTAVLTQVIATAAAVDGTGTQAVNCATTGALETAIVSGLRRKLPR
jgi:hypothetical protein